MCKGEVYRGKLRHISTQLKLMKYKYLKSIRREVYLDECENHKMLLFINMKFLEVWKVHIGFFYECEKQRNIVSKFFTMWKIWEVIDATTG